jgi:hypothetical protein
MHVSVDEWKGKCQVCGEDVSYPKWKCSKRPGNHRMEEKVYFHLGGSHLQNWRERRGWSPLVILKAGQEVQDPRTGTKLLEPTIQAMFSSQQLCTDDPEIQYYIETKGDHCIVWGPEGRKAWERIYLTPDQQKDLANAELAGINRQITEQNELLAQVRGRAGQIKAHA